MANTIQEYLITLSKAIGDIYIGVNTAVGSLDTPGSALFAIQQLEDLATLNMPRFGVLSTSPSGFSVSPSAVDNKFVTVSSGMVGFSGKQVLLPTQDVSITRVFSGTYANTAQYGVSLGIPLSEVSKATGVYQTSVSANAVSTDNTIQIQNIALAQQLGFPLKAQVGNSLLLFSGVDATGMALVIDSGYGNGTSQVSHSAGEFVYFIYEPRVKSLVGMPVDVAWQSGNDPATFSYYHPLPADWLPVANVLVQNPSSPVIANSQNAIISTLIEWPVANDTNPLFNPADANVISSQMNSLSIAIQRTAANISVSDLIRTFEQYTLTLTSGSGNSFRNYWASVPFTATSYFGKGVSFDTLERTEFPDNFNLAYFEIRNTDLQHTFALFRGDMYNNTNSIAGSPPTGFNASTIVPAGNTSSTLGTGTYVYEVTAVNSVGESAPAVVVLSTDSFIQSQNYLADLTWNPVPGVLFYHVYRRANFVGDQSEYRLTTPGQLTTTSFVDNGLPGVKLTGRGVKTTGKVALSPRRLSVFVPPIDTTNVPNVPQSSNALTPLTGNIGGVIANDLLVTVVAQLGKNGTPVTLTQLIPQGTFRNTRFNLGTATQLFDRVLDVQVSPGSNLTLGLDGSIQWSLYDFVTVETSP